MDLIPYCNIKIESDLPLEEIMCRISQNTCKPIDKRHVEKRLEIFEGNVYEHKFKIYRTYNNTRNPFLPIFFGTVISENKKSIISLKITIHKFTALFFLIALLITGIITNGFYLFENSIYHYFILIPCFIYGLLTFSFNQIKKDYLTQLAKIIEGKNLIEL